MRSSVSLAVLLVACGGAEGNIQPEYNPSPALPTTQSGEATPAEGAVAVALACTAGAAERCDAMDDDCDGVIDEGCGYGEGAVAIVATWGNDADVDLEVSGPEGITSAATYHRGSGGCDGETHPRIESATWAEPVNGELTVALRYANACLADQADDREGEATTGSVSLSIGRGGNTQTFNVSLVPGQTTTVATIALTSRP